MRVASLLLLKTKILLSLQHALSISRFLLKFRLFSLSFLSPIDSAIDILPEERERARVCLCLQLANELQLKKASRFCRREASGSRKVQKENVCVGRGAASSFFRGRDPDYKHGGRPSLWKDPLFQTFFSSSHYTPRVLLFLVLKDEGDPFHSFVSTGEIWGWQWEIARPPPSLRVPLLFLSPPPAIQHSERADAVAVSGR